jgi:hypothetical protein
LEIEEGKKEHPPPSANVKGRKMLIEMEIKMFLCS